MIVTVTPNPALDKTAVVRGFRAGEVNRVSESRLDAGGKGVNVSKVLASLGIASVATGICGGANGRFILDLLGRSGIRADFVVTERETRSNLKIADPEGGTTDINESGAPAAPEELRALEEKLLELAAPGDLAVFAGSLPPGAPDDTYARLISLCRARGVRTMLDTSGPALRPGAEALPTVLKPNREELGQLVGREITEVPDLLKACADLRAQGTEIVAVTLGGAGAILSGPEGCFRAAAPKIVVRSTVGSGDAFGAAMAACMESGIRGGDMLALAVAAGAVNAATDGTRTPDGAAIRAMAQRVSAERIGS